jgi:hypothetical protein
VKRNPISEVSDYLAFKRNCKIIFTSDQGKQVLRYLMKKGCVTTPVASSDDKETLRNTGAQRLVLSIVKATFKDETELEQEIENAHDN